MEKLELNMKACFELMVKNNFNSKQITDIISNMNINATYKDIKINAFRYFKRVANQEEKSRYLQAETQEKIDNLKEEEISKEVYEYIIKSKELNENKYPSLNDKSIKLAAEHFNKSKDEILELYYRQALQSKHLTTLRRQSNDNMIILKKYLFYIYINNHLDLSVLEYTIPLKKYSASFMYYREKLESCLRSYVESDAFFTITKEERELLIDMLNKNKKEENDIRDKKISDYYLEENKVFYELYTIMKLQDEEQINYFRNLNDKDFEKILSVEF